MSEPKFSVIIPVYNAERYLRECLDSLVSQHFEDWEAICVDDGSTDASGTILNEYAGIDCRFKVIHQPNSGVSTARNIAHKIAKGEWLMYLDSDDIYLDSAFEVAFRCSSMPYDAILFQKPIGEFPQYGGKAYGDVNVLDFTSSNESGLAFWLRHIAEPSYPWLQLLRRNTFGDIEFPSDISLMEDEVRLIKCLTTASRWAKVNATVCAHRYRPDSLSIGIHPNEAVASVTAVRLVMDILERAKNVPADFRTLYWREKINIIRGCAEIILQRRYDVADSFLGELEALRKSYPFCTIEKSVSARLWMTSHGIPRIFVQSVSLLARIVRKTRRLMLTSK